MITEIKLTDENITHLGKVLGLYVTNVGANETVFSLHNKYTDIMGELYTRNNFLEFQFNNYCIESRKEYDMLIKILEWHIENYDSNKTRLIYDYVN